VEHARGRWSVEDIVATPEDEAELSVPLSEELLNVEPVEKVVLVDP